MTRTIEELAKQYSRYQTDEKGYGSMEEWKQDVAIYYDDAKEVLSWLFAKPIALRLTAEEKERVRTMYKGAVEGNIEMEGMRPLNTFSQNAVVQRMGVNTGCMSTLKAIFGLDFFKEEE